MSYFVYVPQLVCLRAWSSCVSRVIVGLCQASSTFNSLFVVERGHPVYPEGFLVCVMIRLLSTACLS